MCICMRFPSAFSSCSFSSLPEDGRAQASDESLPQGIQVCGLQLSTDRDTDGAAECALHSYV